MLLTGTNIHESQQALKLARRYPIVGRRLASIPMTAVGGHPRPEDAIIALANQPEVVAIGECGLDFNRNFSTPQEQERAFRRSYKLPPNSQMPILCTAGTRMSWLRALLEPR